MGMCAFAASRRRKSSLHLKLPHLVVGSLLAFLGGHILGQKAASSTSALQAELSRLHEELLQLKSTLGTKPPACPACNCASCPACNCPACPACAEKQRCSGGCDQHGKYDLGHLDQPANQDVIGPVQASCAANPFCPPLRL
jgi:hypothetical protein